MVILGSSATALKSQLSQAYSLSQLAACGRDQHSWYLQPMRWLPSLVSKIVLYASLLHFPIKPLCCADWDKWRTQGTRITRKESVFILAALPNVGLLTWIVRFEEIWDSNQRTFCGSLRERYNDTAFDLQILMCMCTFGVSVWCSVCLHSWVQKTTESKPTHACQKKWT